MKFIIVSGMSGAGKSSVLKFLEDDGYFCVDNLPPALLPKFAEICSNPESALSQVAIGVDIRGLKYFDELYKELDLLKDSKFDFQIFFLESSDEVLVKRFKETRRKHPLIEKDERLIDCIKREREALKRLREFSDNIIDTSNLLTRDLKDFIYKLTNGANYNNLTVTVLSFGFKYGIPQDADLVFDVRFIPNPYYKVEMRPYTGNDKLIRDYVMDFDVSKQFLEKLSDMLEFLIPNYVKEGKNNLIIAIGCTGGKHRSVTLANELYKKLLDSQSSVYFEHRDIYKDGLRGKWHLVPK